MKPLSEARRRVGLAETKEITGGIYPNLESAQFAEIIKLIQNSKIPGMPDKFAYAERVKKRFRPPISANRLVRHFLGYRWSSRSPS
jgi:hypothetical protein